MKGRGAESSASSESSVLAMMQGKKLAYALTHTLGAVVLSAKRTEGENEGSFFWW